MPSFIPGFAMPENYIIHVGKMEKVYVNAPIIYKDNLVGRVTQIEDHFSKVLLVSNKSMSFSAKTSETGANGIVRGTGNGNVIFDNVLLSDTLKVGDVVVTSGEVDINGKGFPPDLIVGKITSVEKNPSNLFQKASIAPLVDFRKLTNVFVLMSE
jgi:rod shape-determining protein MreC